MAITLTFNNAPRTRISKFGTDIPARIIGGRARGMSTLPSGSQDVALDAVLAQLAIEGRPMGSMPPGITGTGPFLTEVVISGVTGDIADFELRYEPFRGAVATALIFSTRGSLQPVLVDYKPGTRLPQTVGWLGKKDDSTPPKFISFSVDPAPTKRPRLQPLVTVSATVIRTGFVDNATAADAAGRIGLTNDDTWLGRPAGCWLLTDYQTASSRYDGRFTAKIEAIAKGGSNAPFQDWRAIQFAYSARYGKNVLPDEARLAAAIALPYSFGDINTTISTIDPLYEADHPRGTSLYHSDYDGFAVIGEYDTTSFDDAFSLELE